jgi:outer membrane protein OmpA-like peptidoglycan-associated protein
MHKARIFFCFLLLCFPFLCPSVLWGKTDYSQLDSDSPEVQQAATDALERLGPNRGAIKIQKEVIEILGISGGMAGQGVAVGGRVEEVEKAMKDLGAEVTEKEIRMDLPSDILFDFDKSVIRSDARDSLSKVAVVIRAHPGKIILVEGHTDSKGSEDYNKKLSLQRAESVKRWLQENGNIRDTVFQIKGWGEIKPKATNETEQGRQKNRRVEVTVIK